MANQLDTLIGWQRAEFAEAARLQRYVMCSQIVLLLVSCAAIVIAEEPILYGLSAASLMIAILWVYYDYKHKSSRSLAETIRRATLFTGGLGFELSEHEFRELQIECLASSAEAQKQQDTSFFASKQAPGWQRLGEMLEESAFWSSHLLQYSARRYWILTAGSMGVLVLLFIALVPFVPKGAVAAIGKVACAIFATVVSIDFLGKALAYSDGAAAVKEIQARLQTFKKSAEPNELLIIAADYNSAVESAPMFASGVYEKHQARLNALWKGSFQAMIEGTIPKQ